MLNFINYNERTLIYASNSVDAYGIPTTGEPKEYACIIKESDSLEQITDKDGRVVTITASVSIPRKCEAQVGDYLTVYGEKKRIESKKYIRDYGGNIISTKFGV